MIRLAAEDLGFDRWWGMTTVTRTGICTGDVLSAPARRGGKKAVLTELSRELDIDWEQSFAIGDSSADIEVLDVVGIPVAFEPDAQLRQAARRRGWTAGTETCPANIGQQVSNAGRVVPGIQHDQDARFTLLPLVSDDESLDDLADLQTMINPVRHLLKDPFGTWSMSRRTPSRRSTPPRGGGFQWLLQHPV